MSQSLQKLLDAIKGAMRAGEKEKLTCLRSFHSDVKNISINNKVDITDEVVKEAAAKAVKQRKESLESFEQANRADLVEQNKREMDWLKAFLPEQLDEAAVTKIVEEGIQSSGATSPKDMGKVMQAIMPKVKGKADGKMVSRLVSSKLAALATENS